MGQTFGASCCLVNIGIEVLCVPEEDLTGLVMGCYHSFGWGIHLLQYLHWRR
jgi:hypothetical protein